MQPDRTMPPFERFSGFSVMGLIQQGAHFFPQREDFRWVASNGTEGRMPMVTSCEFPYAGQFFMRSSWERMRAGFAWTWTVWLRPPARRQIERDYFRLWPALAGRRRQIYLRASDGVIMS